MEDTIRSLIFSIAWDQNPSKVRELLAAGADVNEQDEDGVTPLMWAALSGSAEVFEVVFDFRPDVNVRARDSRTALHITAFGGNLHLTQLLLAALARVNVEDDQGITPLMGAAKAGHREVLNRLIEAGANVGARDLNGRTALAWALSGEKATQTIHVLLESGSDPNDRTLDNETMLMRAVRSGNANYVSALLSGGATNSGRNNEGFSALGLALAMGREDLAELLSATSSD